MDLTLRGDKSQTSHFNIKRLNHKKSKKKASGRFHKDVCLSFWPHVLNLVQQFRCKKVSLVWTRSETEWELFVTSLFVTLWRLTLRRLLVSDVTDKQISWLALQIMMVFVDSIPHRRGRQPSWRRRQPSWRRRQPSWRGRQPSWRRCQPSWRGRQNMILPKFLKNYLKLREFWAKRGARNECPLRTTTSVFTIVIYGWQSRTENCCQQILLLWARQIQP